MMEKFIHWTVIVHVICGFAALVTGIVAFLLRKNTPKHKKAGIVYFYLMTVIFVTAIFLSIVKSMLFFFFIAVFTYYSCLVAYRALKLKNLHKGQKPAWIDWAIQVIAGLTFLGLILLGIYVLIFKGSGGIIAIVFGCIGMIGIFQNVKLYLNGPKETLYWLKLHVGNMMGSYIGAITAFLVNQTDKIPINPIFLWLGPTVILVPILTMELRKIKTEKLR